MKFHGPLLQQMLVAPHHRGGIGEAIIPELFAKGLLAELAGRRVGQLVDKFHRVRKPPFGDMGGQVIADLGLAYFGTGCADADQ